MTIKAMAQPLGLTPQALGQRINRLGWTWDEAVNTPKGQTPERLKGRPRGIRGPANGIRYLCQAHGIGRATYYARRRAGLSHEQALKAPKASGGRRILDKG